MFFIRLSQLTFTYSRSTIGALEKGVSIVNFEHISHSSGVSVADVEQVIVSWVVSEPIYFVGEKRVQEWGTYALRKN